MADGNKQAVQHWVLDTSIYAESGGIRIYTPIAYLYI